MIDIDDLKTFAKLPPIFTAKAYKEIQHAIARYDSAKGWVIVCLEKLGDDAYKNPDAYERLIENWKASSIPIVYKDELIAVARQMKSQNCKENHDDKA